MSLFDFECNIILDDLARIGVAFAHAFPIGWKSGLGYTSIGFRTFPIAATAACGFALIVEPMPGTNAESQARVLQSIISGIGFIGGGAIVKQGTDGRGLVTAASIGNDGAIGVAVGYGHVDIAVVLSITNLLVPLLLTPFAERRRTPLILLSIPHPQSG